MGDTKNNDTENLTWLRDEYNHCVFILNHFELQLHDVRQEFTQKFGVVQTTSGRNVASKLLKKTWTHTSQNLLGLNVTKISKDQAQLFSARFDQIQDQMESVRDSANGPLSALQEQLLQKNVLTALQFLRITKQSICQMMTEYIEFLDSLRAKNESISFK